MDKFAHLEALVAVVETGSFSRAAERLRLGKSVISRRISLLEADLGVQLLQRTTRSLSLTGSGREFYERALRILAELDEAEQSIADTSAALRGRLRIAAPLSFGLRHLSATLNAFLHQHPAIELDVDLNDREVNLVEEGFDLAIRIGELPDSSLLARRLGTIRFVTCVSPDYLATQGVPTHPGELSDHVGLQYTNIPPARIWQFDDGSGQLLSKPPGIRLRANNGDLLASAAAAGLGIVNTPTFTASEMIVNGRLVVILDAYPRPAIGIHAVFPPGRLISRRARHLVDFLASDIGDLPAWDRAIGIQGDAQR